MRMAAIEAVIWDFGGVFTSSPFEAFNRFEAEKGLPHDLIRSVNRTNFHDNAWARFERTEIDADEVRALRLHHAEADVFQPLGEAVAFLLQIARKPREIGIVLA